MPSALQVRRGRRCRRRPVVVALGLIVAVAACAGESREEVRPLAPQAADSAAVEELGAGPNLILVTLDTLRADRLGAYGHEEIDTPVIDRLAREGVRFERVASPVPITLPAHASLLTARYPFHTGVRNNGSYVLDPGETTLAEVLAERGYATGGFIGSFVLDARFGVAQGFDAYTDWGDPEGEGTAVVLSDLQRDGSEVVDEALAWLADRDSPFFAWIHLYDPHTPYEPPEPYASRYRGRPYDGEVAYTDTLVGRVLDWIESTGHSRDTLLAVTADHGEGLGDHGEQWHTFFVYESTIRAPLVLWAPGRLPAGVVPTGQASLVDLMPTLLALLGVADPVAESRDGVDLRPWIVAPEARGHGVYAESLVPYLNFGWSELRAWIVDGAKYIRAPRPELYDLQRDPGELANLVDDRPGEAERLAATLAELTAGDDITDPEAAGGMDAETLERLRALGYLGGAGAGVDRRDVDPKDRIEVFETFNDGIDAAVDLLAERRWREAERQLEPLAEVAPDHFMVEHYLGRALLGQGRVPEAIDRLERAMELEPRFSFTWLQLAIAYREIGDADRAVELLREAVDVFPGVATFAVELGTTLHLAERLPEARAVYRQASEEWPDDARLLRNAASLDNAMGRPADAARLLRRLVELEPEDGRAWGDLGTSLAQATRFREAEEALSRAGDLLPREPRVHFNHALVLLRLGRSGEAVAAAQRALAADPGFEEARRLLEQIGGP